MSISAQQAAQYGFVFGPGFRDWIVEDNMPRLARDAALVTTPSTTVPAEFLAYIDPRVIDILTAPRKAREIFTEVKKGDWTTSYAKFRAVEFTGATQPYTDYGQSGMSGVNYDWLTREQYLYQTIIQYGDLEQAVTSAAKITLAADKQRSAANTIDIDANRFYLQGVAGRKIYGLLNEPTLSAPMTPAPSGTGDSVEWADKSTQQIYNDIRALFGRLVAQSRGWIDQSTPLVLALSPDLSVELGKATDYNVSVQDMLDKFFRNLAIVTLPELSSATTGETMMMIAREVNGTKTAELGYSEKLRAGRVIPDLSSFSQKWTAGTYGAIVYLPFAVAQMRGM